jgi:hypothetical protein
MANKRLTYLIRQRPWIMAIDEDEPGSFTVTLHEPWCFRAVRGPNMLSFNSFKKVEEGTRKSSVYEDLGRGGD